MSKAEKKALFVIVFLFLTGLVFRLNSAFVDSPIHFVMDSTQIQTKISKRVAEKQKKNWNQKQIRKSGLKQRIKINTASLDELIRLKGIGTKTAKRIIEFRKSGNCFKSPKDLLKIKGIGAQKLKKIQESLIFD